MPPRPIDRTTNGLLYDLGGDGAIDSYEELLRTLANDVYSAIMPRPDR